MIEEFVVAHYRDIIFFVQLFLFWGLLPILICAFAIRINQRHKLMSFLSSVSICIGGLLFGAKLEWGIIPTICSILPGALMMFVAMSLITPKMSIRYEMRGENK